MPGLNEIVTSTPELPPTVRMQGNAGSGFTMASANNNSAAMEAMRKDALTRSAEAPSREAFEARTANFVANLAARNTSRDTGTYLG